jgi:hypothetical protein
MSDNVLLSDTTLQSLAGGFSNTWAADFWTPEKGGIAAHWEDIWVDTKAGITSIAFIS